MDGEARNMERIETLRELLDRLGSPDLTLDEAKPLRDRLFMLLGHEGQLVDSPSEAWSQVSLRLCSVR